VATLQQEQHDAVIVKKEALRHVFQLGKNCLNDRQKHHHHRAFFLSTFSHSSH